MKIILNFTPKISNNKLKIIKELTFYIIKIYNKAYNSLLLKEKRRIKKLIKEKTGKTKAEQFWTVKKNENNEYILFPLYNKRDKHYSYSLRPDYNDDILNYTTFTKEFFKEFYVKNLKISFPNSYKDTLHILIKRQTRHYEGSFVKSTILSSIITSYYETKKLYKRFDRVYYTKQFSEDFRPLHYCGISIIDEGYNLVFGGRKYFSNYRSINSDGNDFLKYMAFVDNVITITTKDGYTEKYE